MASPGQLDKLEVAEELVTWGVKSTEVFTAIPYDDFSILPENDAKIEEKATGSRYSLYVVTTKQDVRGTLVMQVWPDTVALSHDMCGMVRTAAVGNIPADYPSSYSMRWYNRADGNTYLITGARPDTARITVSEGDPILKMSIDFIAKSFALDTAGNGADTTTDVTLPSGDSFQMSDMGLWWSPAVITAADNIAAEEETSIEELTIELRQNLRAGGKRDKTTGFRKTITRLDAGVVDCEVSGSIVMHPDSEQRMVDYMDYVISDNAGVALGVKFNYPGTGSPVDIFTYTLRNLVIRKVDPPASIREVKVMRFSGVVEATGVSVAPVVFTSGAWASP